MPFYTGVVFLHTSVCGKLIYAGQSKSVGDNSYKMWLSCCQIPQCKFHINRHVLHVFLVFCKTRIFMGMGFHSIVLYW